MKFTFGITTNNGVLTSKIVESIRREKIPEYEIIVIGSTLVTGEDIINISFDENQKFGWNLRIYLDLCTFQVRIGLQRNL